MVLSGSTFQRAASCTAILLALVLTSLLPLWIPLSRLLNIENMGFRYLAASLLTFSPIFFANLLFSLHFRSQQFPQRVFAWNLMGACVGGMVEYLSMAFGYRALAVLVVICYLAAFGLLMMRRRTASERDDVAGLSSPVRLASNSDEPQA